MLPPGEGLPAGVAGVGLLAGVGEDVAPQVLVADERLATHPALVGSWDGLAVRVVPEGEQRRLFRFLN